MLNSVFLHHCVEAGLDLAMVNPNHITPYAEIPEDERELADDLVFNRREDALERFIAHFEAKGPTEAEARARPTRPRAWSPRRRCTSTSCAARRRASRTGSTAASRRSAPSPTLNEVLLPAMKEVGDKFGAGELILPFVLQSAEVMKRAVAQLERYLDKIEGYTKGTVVIATVFGDVHDIGKSLVNTILTNNGYTVVDLGKQVPISTILDAAVEHKATAIGLERAAGLDLQADAGLRPGAARARARVPGADRRRRDQPQLRPADPLPARHRVRRRLRARRVLLQGRVRGAGRRWTSWSTPRRAQALVAKTRERRPSACASSPTATDDDAPPVTDASVRSAAATDNPIPEPPFWGVRELEVRLDEVYRHLDTHVLFKLHWGGRGVKGEEWKRLLREDFQPRLERMWREQTYLHPRALLGYFPCNSDGNELIVWDPEAARGPRRSSSASSSPASPGTTGSAWPTSTARSGRRGRRRRPPGGHRRRRGDRADGEARGRGRVRRAAVRPRPRRADRRGDGRVAARAACAPTWASSPTQGRRYSWGYPACPEQSEHEKVFGLLDAPSIGLRLSGGYAVEPEQSTLAIVAHHPQAVYFGMKSGFAAQDRPGRRPTS